MRLWWTHLWKSEAYRRGNIVDRRMIELRFCISRALKTRRRTLHMSQRQLAETMHVSQAAISRVERASNRVSLDIAMRALLTVGFTDAELADVFFVENSPGIINLRRRAQERAFPKPALLSNPTNKGEHRFVRKRPGQRRLPDPDDD